MVRVTATVWDGPVAGVIVMAPVYRPAAIPCGLVEMVKVAGVLLPDDVTNSHALFPALAVKAVDGVPVSAIVCG